MYYTALNKQNNNLVQEVNKLNMDLRELSSSSTVESENVSLYKIEISNLSREAERMKTEYTLLSESLKASELRVSMPCF